MKIIFIFVFVIFTYQSASYDHVSKNLKELSDSVELKFEKENQFLNRVISRIDELEEKYDEWGYTCCKVKKGYKFCIVCCDKWEIASCNMGIDSLNCTCKY